MLYAINIVTAEIIIAEVNLKPFFRSNGKTKKKINDGRTAQKMLVDRSMIFCTSFVSLYNQIIASIDTSGSEAKTAATGANFFPSSDTPAMMRAERTIFMRYCIGVRLTVFLIYSMLSLCLHAFVQAGLMDRCLLNLVSIVNYPVLKVFYTARFFPIQFSLSF